MKQEFDAFDASILLDLFENQYYANKNYSLFDGRFSHISLFQKPFSLIRRKPFAEAEYHYVSVEPA
ncbi:hypothetical protein KD913_04115 [Klebsiella pneumoniae]